MFVLRKISVDYLSVLAENVKHERTPLITDNPCKRSTPPDILLLPVCIVWCTIVADKVG